MLDFYRTLVQGLTLSFPSRRDFVISKSWVEWNLVFGGKFL